MSELNEVDESQPIETLSAGDIVSVLRTRCQSLVVAGILPNNKSPRAITILVGSPLLCEGLVRSLQILSTASLEEMLSE